MCKWDLSFHACECEVYTKYMSFMQYVCESWCFWFQQCVYFYTLGWKVLDKVNKNINQCCSQHQGFTLVSGLGLAENLVFLVFFPLDGCPYATALHRVLATNMSEINVCCQMLEPISESGYKGDNVCYHSWNSQQHVWLPKNDCTLHGFSLVGAHSWVEA